MDDIKKYKLEKECNLIFDNLNKSNIKYNSISFISKDFKDIDYLKQFNINYSLFQNLKITSESSTENNIDYFFKPIFSLKNIQNHLIQLGISLKEDTHVSLDSIKGINSLKLLEVLLLKYISIEDNSGLFLKLKHLKELYLSFCFNINFDDSCSNLIKLEMKYSSIKKPNTPLIMPKLEYLEIKGLYQINNKGYFDFKSLNKIKRIL